MCAATAAAAAIPGQDPNWPCQQPLVPEETAQTFWAGPLPSDVNWRDNPRVAKLVADIAPRDASLDDAEAEIKAFRTETPAADRPAMMALAFTGIVDETNRQRSEVITRLEDLNTRQRNIAALATKAEIEADSIPATAEGDDAARRAEAMQRNEFLTRTFTDTRKTIRYACEIPGQIDSRLGKYAKMMQESP
jgi:hypothetical protein